MSEITVNITSCGRWDDLRRLLRSLEHEKPQIQIALTQDVECPEDLKPWVKIMATAAPSARNALWQTTTTPYAVFLDEDCEINSIDYLNRIQLALSQNNEPKVALGGNYESARAQTLLQKSYNFVTQIWTLRNTSDSLLFLGGHFALFQKDLAHQRLFDPQTAFGGEEFNLLKNLKEQDFYIQWNPELKVIHHPSSSWNHFFQRAKLHSKAHTHPTPITKNYLTSLFSVCKKNSFSVVSAGLFYLSLVYFFRLFARASVTNNLISLSKANPELLAERTKSSVGSRFGLALASRKNK